MSDRIYDNSQLQQFKSCPESYRLKYVEKLRKRQEGIEHHHANFGSAIHSGLECLYKGHSWSEVENAFADSYKEQLDSEDLAKTRANGIELLRQYYQRYKQEDKQFDVLGAEVQDVFELGSIKFRVKIDLVIKQQGCVYFMDHKTTGKAFNWMYWSQFEPNSQITAYTAYCMAKYGECSGGIINAMRFGFRKRAYKGEPAGFYSEFQRQVFNRDQRQVESWKKDTISWTARLAETARHAPLGSWDKNEGNCMWCPYKEVCISCADEQVIEQLYEVCDPYEYLKEVK